MHFFDSVFFQDALTDLFSNLSQITWLLNKFAYDTQQANQNKLNTMGQQLTSISRKKKYEA